MAEIPVVQARALFTQTLIAIFSDMKAPSSFFRSFFKRVESGSKLLSIEVQRNLEKIAVDVERGSDGNRNKWSKSTEKIILPPYYHEFFDMTQLDLYDRLFSASGTINENTMAEFMNEVARKTAAMRDLIERAYEKQCADVLLTGVVSLNSGVTIDFKRKADSLVTLGAGARWTVSGQSPYDTLESGANFIRQKGKFGGDILNVIMGSSVYNAFLKNDVVTARADNLRISLDQINEPQRKSDGTLQGRTSAGSYKFNIWTYPEFYDNASNVSTPYMDASKIIILPESPEFVLGFAAVPQLISTGGIASTKGQYLISEYVDPKKVAHEIDIKSAGIAIPVAVDQIYTAKVVA